MSAVIRSNRGELCAICKEEFGWLEKLGLRNQRVTHVGGEGHDGMHRKCLAEWLRTRLTPKCPYDEKLIDQASINTRTYRILDKFESALTNAVYAACFGVAAGVGAAAAAGVVGGVVGVGGVVAGVGGVSGVGVVAGVAGVGVTWILDRKGVSQINHENIGAGMYIGAIVGFVAAVTPPAALLVISLVGSIATVTLSLIRK